MDVFIVRPFGIKKVLPKNASATAAPVDFDFEKVNNDLIAPALSQLALEGGTTGKIFEPGDIREDMFSLLLLADLVIADITIHNANVFYELGIRHALRDRKTILLKSSGFSETPFDIMGYRYLEYDKDDPAKALPLLVQTIEATRQTNRPDSPVFKMLPKLESQNSERFIAVPADYTEEVRVACENQQIGKLSLLALEAAGFQWEIPGLRSIGLGLFNLKALDAARTVWEKIRSGCPGDRQANDRLATIYQRLAERELLQNPAEAAALLARSDLAIDNLLSDYANLNKHERAEAYALKGRNTKTRWINIWKNAAPGGKGPAAVQSGYLETAFRHYEHGYYENLNHYYTGINALSLLTMIIALAEAYPAEWALKFKKQREADAELDEWKEKKANLAVSVQTSIEAERRRLDTTAAADIWLSITDADFTFLTETNPARITARYKAALEGGQAFHFDAAQRQVQIFEQLGILPANVQAALSAIPATQSIMAQATRYLLFTGHMIDQPGRKEPRFPPEKETWVRQKIKTAVEAEKTKADHNYRGITGGACGGDILFHEVCAEAGIETEMYLALPRDQFIVESVQFAGPEWIERFNELYKKIPHQVLSQKKELPDWLRRKPNYSIWERNNLWELSNALVNGGMHTTLIALWDGKGGDGAGGTEHMVKEAGARGARVVVIDMNEAK